MTELERAKELFLKYNGNRFYMDHDGEGYKYESYHVSKETEEGWAKEFIDDFLNTKLYGKEAIRAYITATELLKSDRKNDDWEKCLYYPLRADHLDDVTILYMLPISFRMAEKAMKKNSFSPQEAASYREELDAYSRKVLDRAAKGTLTRATDYVMQEFSDPAYVEKYLDELRQKWK